MCLIDILFCLKTSNNPQEFDNANRTAGHIEACTHSCPFFKRMKRLTDSSTDWLKQKSKERRQTHRYLSSHLTLPPYNGSRKNEGKTDLPVLSVISRLLSRSNHCMVYGRSAPSLARSCAVSSSWHVNTIASPSGW